MTTWYTSDWHFGHRNILQYCQTFRPWGTVEEMNAGLVQIWNNQVSPGDLVIVLGDMCMGKLDDTLQFVGQLNGDKVLVPGNHDAVHPVHHRGRTEEKRAAETARYLEAGFSDVWELEVTELVPNGDEDLFVRLCHFPYEAVDHTEEVRYGDQCPHDDGETPLIHGHVHGLWVYRGRQMNVGFDAWGRLVAEDEIAQFVRRFA
jgi:calcineurin-like phosphoesterase family protein